MSQESSLQRAQRLLSNSTVIGTKIAHKNVEQIQAFALLSIAESLDAMHTLMIEMNYKLERQRL